MHQWPDSDRERRRDQTLKRFALGQSVLKLVTFDEPPAEPSAAAGVRDRATGFRSVTLVVANAREMHAKLAAAGHPIDEPITEFAPGVGYFFVVDPDGKRVELAGPI